MKIITIDEYNNRIFEGVGFCGSAVQENGSVCIWEKREPRDWTTLENKQSKKFLEKKERKGFFIAGTIFLF